MTLEDKVGQLFMIRAHSDLGPDHIKSVEDQIKKYKVGGLCFFQGTPTKQAELTQKYQNLSTIPLFVSQDAEWGLGMRLKDKAISYPKQLTLGAIKDNTLIYDMGRDIAMQLKRIGVNINFAPVTDINNNPSNPVIHNRSFGEDMFNVATKSFAYMRGMQENGIMACAKHFPGHGDTDMDSHYDLPLISHDRERLDSLELMPFRVLSQLGVQSMMTAHLSVPALDASINRPTSLSRKVVTGLLQEDMDFKGLIFTDGLEMKGVADHFSPGIMELEAIKAGNDIIQYMADVMGLPMSDKGTSGGPDIIPMFNEGVPAMRFQQDGTDYFDLHHTPDDTFDKIDAKEMAQNVAAFVTLIWTAGNADTNFRTE
jgi:beta-glucosidase-like glycosyl hydrolase